MEDQELATFSWIAFFFVTSFSLFLFSGVLKLLDGAHAKEFILAGIITLFLGVVSWLRKFIMTGVEHKSKKNNKQYS